MIGTIVWLIGLVCAIWCVLDIFKKNISTGGKVIAAVVVLLTSWVGPVSYTHLDVYKRQTLRRLFSRAPLTVIELLQPRAVAGTAISRRPVR